MIDKVLLGHGSGGALMADLLKNVVFAAFPDVQPTDGALANVPAGMRLVFTTDSFVVKPLFFPGGDIGRLAVNGTVNDLAMMGAEPALISCGLIIEEGFALDDLRRICASMSRAAMEAGARIVTGDTKVVGHGEADSIFINTSGIGYAQPVYGFSPDRVKAGDVIIVNGGLGEHGIAVMAGRLGVSFAPELPSDSAPLWPQVKALLGAGIVPGVMRDITRGGLGSVAAELAAGLPLDYHLREACLPVDARVAKACDIWGFDPLYVASEGRFLLSVGPAQVEETLRLLGPAAASIGEVSAGTGRVFLHTTVGGVRPVRPLPGEMLPRIC